MELGEIWIQTGLSSMSVRAETLGQLVCSHIRTRCLKCANQECADVGPGPRAALSLRLSLAPLGVWVLDASLLCSQQSLPQARVVSGYPWKSGSLDQTTDRICRGRMG